MWWTSGPIGHWHLCSQKFKFLYICLTFSFFLLLFLSAEILLFLSIDGSVSSASLTMKWETFSSKPQLTDSNHKQCLQNFLSWSCDWLKIKKKWTSRDVDTICHDTGWVKTSKIGCCIYPIDQFIPWVLQHWYINRGTSHSKLQELLVELNIKLTVVGLHWLIFAQNWEMNQSLNEGGCSIW